jgi:enamine deaminase RidA (YjgF/YER057c/UK114 family)
MFSRRSAPHNPMETMTRRTAVASLAAVAAAPLEGAPPSGPPKHRSHHVEKGSAYCQAHEVIGARRLLFVSGQVPVAPDESVPADFKSQARQVWAHIAARLADASMGLDDLVKVTIFLSDRRYRADNAAVRKEVLADRTPALTIVITGIYDEAWLLEIEAVAAA